MCCDVYLGCSLNVGTTNNHHPTHKCKWFRVWTEPSWNQKSSTKNWFHVKRKWNKTEDYVLQEIATVVWPFQDPLVYAMLFHCSSLYRVWMDEWMYVCFYFLALALASWLGCMVCRRLMHSFWIAVTANLCRFLFLSLILFNFNEMV